MACFPKQSKLCGQTRIDNLYRTGKRFVQWPLRVTWLPTESETQVLIWAPKSLFKHAVDRNHLRRLMREAYRAEQQPIQDTEKHYHIAFNYLDKEPQSLTTIQKAVRKALQRICAN